MNLGKREGLLRSIDFEGKCGCFSEIDSGQKTHADPFSLWSLEIV